MKHILRTMSALLLCASVASAQQYVRLWPNGAEGEIDANAEAVTVDGVRMMGTVGVQVTGSYTGTLAAQCSLDNTNWQAIRLTPTNTTTAVTEVTSTGIWTGVIAGCEYVRVAATAWTTGTAVVTINTIQTGGGSNGGSATLEGDITIDLTATNALLTTIDADTSNMAVSLAALDNAVAGNELQVDVLTMPTVTVTGTVTANLSATDNAVLDDIADGIAVTATNLDVQSGGADLALASHTDGLEALLATENTNSGTIAGDTTAIEAAVEAVLTPVAPGAATATSAFAAGGQYNLTPPTFTDGQQGVLQLSSSGALLVSGGGGGTEYTVNAAAPANPTGNAPVAERDDALSALTEVEGDWTNLRTDANGALWTIVSGTVTVGSHAVTNAGTFAVQAAQSGTWDEVGINDSGNSITVDAADLDVQSGGADILSTTAFNAAFGTAGVSDTQVISVQGIASGTAMTVSATNLDVQIGGSDTLTVTATNLDIQSGGADLATSTQGASIVTAVELIDNAISGAGFNITQLAGAATPMTTTQADNLATTLDSLNVSAFTYVYDGSTFDMLRGDATNGVLVNLGSNNDVDTELPTAGALSDAMANPTTPLVGAAMMGWNGTTWDRLTPAEDYAQGSTTSGQTGPLQQGAVTTSSPTYTSGQTSPLSLDTSGSLRVNVVSGSTGNAASSNTASAVPTQAGYTGVNVGGTLRGLTAVNPSGSIYAAQVDMAAIAGATAAVNAGTLDAGTLRVTVATNDEINDDLDAIATSTGLLDNAVYTATAADDLANTLDGLYTSSFMYGYDGTTWDRVLATGGALHVGDGAGALNVICDSGCSGGTQYTHNAALTADSSVGGAQIALAKDFDGTALPNIVSAEGDAVIAAASLYGVQYVMLVNEDGSTDRGSATTPIYVNTGTGFGDDAAFTIGTSGIMGIGCSASADTMDAGDIGLIYCGTDRELDVDIASIAAGDNDIGNVDLEIAGTAIAVNAGAASAQTLRMVIATDDPVNDYAVLMGANLVAHDAADAGSPLKVGGYASTAVPTAVSAAGDRVNAWYTLNGAAVVSPGGGLAHYRTAAGTTEDEHEIKATAGTLYSVLITNTNAAARYIRCYNLTAANTTPGTSTVFWGAAIPGATTGAGFSYHFPSGLTFDTALTCAWTTGAADTDVAEVTANEIKATYTYR